LDINKNGMGLRPGRHLPVDLDVPTRQDGTLHLHSGVDGVLDDDQERVDSSGFAIIHHL
jgi:hypothetical protein